LSGHVSHEASEPSASLSAGLAALVKEEEGALADLARLIALDTSFPPGRNYPACADLLEQMLMPSGFVFRRVTVPSEFWRRPEGEAEGERVNLMAARRRGRPVCSLYFHVDTVPADAGWTRPPHALTREGNRLFGRGTADMKGTIAATLMALRAAAAAQLPLAYDPVLLFCTDEEGGLYPGIRYLAEQGLVEGHLLSFNGGAVPRIWAGCFGSFDLLIRIRGRAAHSGDPIGGINAIDAALPVFNALAALKARVTTRRSALPAPPHYGDRPLTSLLTVAAAHGGRKGSALPATFEILVNRRYAPEERFEDALGEIEDTVRQALRGGDALGFETRLLGHLAPVQDPTGPHWPRWQAALSLGFGYPAEAFRPWGSSTSSDMGWVQQAGIRELLLGGLARPGNNIHAADEHTTTEDLMALARSILAYLAADFAAPLIPENATGGLP